MIVANSEYNFFALASHRLMVVVVMELGVAMGMEDTVTPQPQTIQWFHNPWIVNPSGGGSCTLAGAAAGKLVDQSNTVWVNR